MIKLALPIWYGERKFTECEIKKPSGAVLADTKKLFDQGNIYIAFHHFVSGCIDSIIDTAGDWIDEPSLIKTVTRNLKQKAIEKLCIDILLNYDSKDGVEGVYDCPRCGEKIICELNNDFDSRDFISDLETVYYDKEDDFFEYELEEPFEITNKTESILFIKSLGFRHPEISDCIDAYSRFGQHDRVRMQYLIYVKCIKTINGEIIDETFRKRWGMYFFEKYENKDINEIAKEMNNYGLETRVNKICNKCGKEWKAHLNTANFFVSALSYED